MGRDKNNPKMDFSFLWSQGTHVILDQKSYLGFSQRYAPLVELINTIFMVKPEAWLEAINTFIWRQIKFI